MNPFQNALKQLQKAADLMNLDKSVFERFKKPDNILQVSLPVKMDDGNTKVFEGYRVQHNNARGPYKGGLRYHPKTNLNEVKALAFWMAIKTSVVGIPLGGAKGGITVDPKRLSKNEFVFTADAVRNAGEGDVDKGAEVMYNMMKNLESGGEVSEESQGLEGAREMFQTSKRLEEVL